MKLCRTILSILVMVSMASTTAFAEIEGGYCGQMAIYVGAAFKEVSFTYYELGSEIPVSQINVSVMGTTSAKYLAGKELSHDPSVFEKVEETYLVSEEVTSGI